MSVRSKRSVKDGTRGGCRGITRVFAAFAMVLGSVVALQSPAAAAPGNLKDIDVAHVSARSMWLLPSLRVAPCKCNLWCVLSTGHLFPSRLVYCGKRGRLR